jgi:hypothetical protein
VVCVRDMRRLKVTIVKMAGGFRKSPALPYCCAARLSEEMPASTVPAQSNSWYSKHATNLCNVLAGDTKGGANAFKRVALLHSVVLAGLVAACMRRGREVREVRCETKAASRHVEASRLMKAGPSHG